MLNVSIYEVMLPLLRRRRRCPGYWWRHSTFNIIKRSDPSNFEIVVLHLRRTHLHFIRSHSTTCKCVSWICDIASTSVAVAFGLRFVYCPFELLPNRIPFGDSAYDKCARWAIFQPLGKIVEKRQPSFLDHFLPSELHQNSAIAKNKTCRKVMMMTDAHNKDVILS